jgi:DNA-binding NarL/FixJ family response regulator
MTDISIISELQRLQEKYPGAPNRIDAMITGSFYVIDLCSGQFVFVADRSPILGGYRLEEALQSGYDFFSKVIYADDLPLVTKMHHAVINRLANAPDAVMSRVDYFSCTFRLQQQVQGDEKALTQMVYHRMRPVCIEGKLRYGICTFNFSAIKEPGNLRAYYCNDTEYDAWEPATREWRHVQIKPLTLQEKKILTLILQGQTDREMAGQFCVSLQTLRNNKNGLFRKLDVHSKEQAIIFANNHRTLYMPDTSSGKDRPDTAVPRRRTSHTLTRDMLKDIQKALDSGQSVHSIAKQKGIAENSIRYAIKHKKLKK